MIQGTSYISLGNKSFKTVTKGFWTRLGYVFDHKLAIFRRMSLDIVVIRVLWACYKQSLQCDDVKFSWHWSAEPVHPHIRGIFEQQSHLRSMAKLNIFFYKEAFKWKILYRVFSFYVFCCIGKYRKQKCNRLKCRVAINLAINMDSSPWA